MSTTIHHSASSLSLFAALLLAPTASAQVSEYFLMAGDQGSFHVIRGGVLQRSWATPVGTAKYQYPLAVTGTVRTMGAAVAEIGGEYDLNGVDLTLRYTHPAGTGRCWDGTTDGTRNYAIDASGLVWGFDAFWNNPVQLFAAGDFGGLTYDSISNTLWVSHWSVTTMITEYTLTGVKLRSFNAGHSRNMALAHDPADGTLWLHDRNATGTFEQWTKTGVLLNRIAVPGMSTQNAIGGEFSIAKLGRCTFRNGTNLNLPDYACVTRPALGTGWTTSFNAGAGTTATAILLGTAGAATGPNLLNGELLISLATPPIPISGAGNIVFPIPNNPSLGGAVVATQGVRLDNTPLGPQVLLLNAQDLLLGL